MQDMELRGLLIPVGGNVVEDQAEILRLARTQGSGSDGFDIYVGLTRTDQADGYLFHLRGFA